MSRVKVLHPHKSTHTACVRLFLRASLQWSVPGFCLAAAFRTPRPLVRKRLLRHLLHAKKISRDQMAVIRLMQVRQPSISSLSASCLATRRPRAVGVDAADEAQVVEQLFTNPSFAAEQARRFTASLCSSPRLPRHSELDAFAELQASNAEATAWIVQPETAAAAAGLRSSGAEGKTFSSARRALVTRDLQGRCLVVAQEHLHAPLRAPQRM